MTLHATQTACNCNHLHVPQWGACLHKALLHPELPLWRSLGKEESHSSLEKSQVFEAQRMEGKSSHLRTGPGPAHHWRCCCSVSAPLWGRGKGGRKNLKILYNTCHQLCWEGSLRSSTWPWGQRLHKWLSSEDNLTSQTLITVQED